MLAGRDVRLSVDGGVTEANVRDLARSGADVVVAGSSAFAGGRDAYEGNVARLRANARPVPPLAGAV